MDLKISRQKAEWNDSPYGDQKDVIIVEFPNCTFKWLPTYKQCAEIIQALLNLEEEQWKKQEI